MDAIHTIKGYDKVGEAGCHDSCHRRAHRRLLILASSAAVVIAFAAAAALCVLISIKRHDGAVPSFAPTPSPASATVRAVCNLTRFPDSCLSALSSPNASSTSDPEVLLKLSLLAALDAYRGVEPLPNQLLAAASDPRAKSALSVCSEVVGDAVGMVNDSLALMVPAKDGAMLTPSKISDIRTWLSSALTDATTCLDSFDEAGVTGHVRDTLAAALKIATELTSNGLAIATGLEGLLQQLHLPLHRKLLGAVGDSLI